MKMIHVIVAGLVQGVCFREYTRRRAFTLQLTGWVRNLPDGTVEAMLSGPDDKVAAMLLWLHQGSPHSRVDKVVASEVDSTEIFATFEIYH